MIFDYFYTLIYSLTNMIFHYFSHYFFHYFYTFEIAFLNNFRSWNLTNRYVHCMRILRTWFVSYVIISLLITKSFTLLVIRNTVCFSIYNSFHCLVQKYFLMISDLKNERKLGRGLEFPVFKTYL